MKDQLISFDTAKLANKKGFGAWTEKRYNKKGGFNESKAWSISAPTQSLLQKWLRETHNIHMILRPFFDSQNTDTFSCDVIRRSNGRVIKSWRFDSYELALEIGLQEALKLI